MTNCIQCLVAKSENDFYKSNKSRCKDCVKKSVKKHRAEKIDYYRQYDRTRALNPNRMAKSKEIVSLWKWKYPERRKAQVALDNAVRDGRVKKLPCFVCGEKAEAHHPDYSAPLDVVWLCPPHHKQTHAMHQSERVNP